MRTAPPLGPGLQPERTALAWRRTALSVAVGSLVATRMLSEPLGAAGVLVGVLGLLWSLDLALIARRRYAAAQRVVQAGSGADEAGAGHAIVRTCWATVVTGACALVAVVVISAGR